MNDCVVIGDRVVIHTLNNVDRKSLSLVIGFNANNLQTTLAIQLPLDSFERLGPLSSLATMLSGYLMPVFSRTAQLWSRTFRPGR